MRTGVIGRLALWVFVGVVAAGGVRAEAPQEPSHPDIGLFFLAIAEDDDQADEALASIAASWRDGYAGIVWDLMRFMAPPRRPQVAAPTFRNPNDAPGAGAQVPRLEPEHPTTRVWRRLMRFLETQSGERFRNDVARAHQWIWDQPYDPHPDYALFKALWYAEIDPRFREFFPPAAPATIRLDEIDWGGVPPNGIPPLEYPAHLAAADAGYLDDDDIVFGIAMNGERRAYPKRILAWHEMAIDRIGGVELTIVYCTLCGTVIPYESVVDGEHIRFGTSGLLYRSNKLMFDVGTKSLWSTFEGVPVVGALVGSPIRLRHRSVVTTTWGEWRRTHPDTTVLSLETGHRRDYSEGAAYRDYFATDRLMFEVSLADERLDNKDEVLVMLLTDAEADPDAAGERHPVAISERFLRDNRLFETEQAGRRLVVVTTEAGANRVYETGSHRMTRTLDDGGVVDAGGSVWRVTEDALVAEAPSDDRLPRVAAQRAFWFGWFAQFPDTILIK